MGEDDFSDGGGKAKLTEGDSLVENFLEEIFANQDLLLLLLVLFIFLSKRDSFSKELKFLNNQANNLKKYLEATDATLQALDQASQMPNQILD
ncbi:MAG: hypothetical protein ACQEP9_04850 [Bacillota bacterium]